MRHASAARLRGCCDITVRGAAGAMLLLVVFSFAAGCAAPRSDQLPAIVEGGAGQQRVGKFVWFDLLSNDAAASREFYSAWLQWDMDASGQDPAYTVIRLDGKPIGGISDYREASGEPFDSTWLASLSVPNLEGAITAVGDGGGEMLHGPIDAGPRGRLAVIRDPVGAELVLLTSAAGDPPDRPVAEGGWAWVDLLTQEPPTAVAFYGSLVDYQVREVEPGSGTTRTLLHGGRARAGIVEIPWEDVEANWLPYVWVREMDAAIARAESLGGHLMIRVDDAAVMMDPTGAAIGLQAIPNS